MASKGIQSLGRSLRCSRITIDGARDPLTQCLAPQLSRSMATEARLPRKFSKSPTPPPPQSGKTTAFTFPDPTVLTTIYKFPSMEPLHFQKYDAKHLHLPLRRDILHRAVIFEGDFTRQGTASTKTRYEVHGGHRKIRPQKGSGNARLGTRQSPMLVGGGKSFGPHPRDFATGLPKKMYDLAWRTALSWRYRRGELIVCENGMDLEYPEGGYVEKVFEHNGWGREDGRSLVITKRKVDNLTDALEEAGEHGRVLTLEAVDVKDLLELGRVIIEKGALEKMLEEHQSDLVSSIKTVV